MYWNKRIRYVDLATINQHIKYCYNYRKIVFRERQDHENIGLTAFVNDKLRFFELTYKYAGDVTTYIFDKATGSLENHQQITGLQAFTMLNRYTHVNRVITKADEAPFSAVPLLWFNPKLEGKRVDAICYDINSAYSYAMIQAMPDTSIPPKQKYIEPGEIGFDVNGNRQTSGYSLFVFNLMESPFKKYVEHFFKKKNTAKNLSAKRKAKEYLNFCVGFLQHRDPYTRAQIVGLANDRILSLMDENTIYCNTDSIVSLTERPDLELGTDIGQWKIEHKGKFAFKGYNYQWNFDPPSVRGKSKTDFKEGWDLLKDGMPDNGNLYKFNRIRGVMEDA